jgi:ABC-type antimicrobial peptide transport system permease subunit
MQILLNIIFYAFLVWLMYDATIIEKDYWFAFVVGFVISVAVVCQLMPSLHASKVSPGEFPYDTIGD